jgi:hypothetical protein
VRYREITASFAMSNPEPQNLPAESAAPEKITSYTTPMLPSAKNVMSSPVAQKSPAESSAPEKILSGTTPTSSTSDTTAPSAPTSPSAQNVDNQKEIDLEAFRTLLGMENLPTNTEPKTQKNNIKIATRKMRPSFLPKWLQRDLADDPVSEASIYLTLVEEERSSRMQYFLYDVLIYSCMISQLMIASALVILGATAGDHHIAVAVLGAVTGIITGVLSLIKGQGLPTRLIQYAEGLRKVREDIDSTERGLRTQAVQVKYAEVEALRKDYEDAREAENKNRPDVWATFQRRQ